MTQESPSSASIWKCTLGRQSNSLGLRCIPIDSSRTFSYNLFDEAIQQIDEPAFLVSLRLNASGSGEGVEPELVEVTRTGDRQDS